MATHAADRAPEPGDVWARRDNPNSILALTFVGDFEVRGRDLLGRDLFRPRPMFDNDYELAMAADERTD